MTDILKAFKVKRAEVSYRERSPAEQRALEMRALQPEKLKPYAGAAPSDNKIKQRTVMLVFKDDEGLDLMCKHFHVANYVAKSVTNIDKLVALLREMEAGRITYDKKGDRIVYNQERPRKGSPAVVTRTRRPVRKK
jgi:hypothetical protein